MNIVFVYSKNGIIKCFNSDTVKDNMVFLEGWVHTATIDPFAYIEYLCNYSKSIQNDFKKLLKPTN